MKNTTALTLILASAIACSSVYAVSTKKVQSGISRSITFTILPTKDGRIDKCSFKSVIELSPKSKPINFQPSQKYVENACKVSLAKGQNWIPEADVSGNYKEIEESCFWSKAVPDTPICRVETQVSFADEIPMGMGNIAVFGLTPNSNGQITSCRLASLKELTVEAKEVKSLPHALFIQDACRKLSSKAYKTEIADKPQKETFMYCRQVPQNPVRAYCELKFGE